MKNVFCREFLSFFKILLVNINLLVKKIYKKIYNVNI